MKIKKCRKCHYGKKFDTRHWYCDYLCMELERRPCSVYECTVFKPRQEAAKQDLSFLFREDRNDV